MCLMSLVQLSYTFVYIWSQQLEQRVLYDPGHLTWQSFLVWSSLLVLLFILVSHFSSGTFSHKNIERFPFSFFPLSELIQEIFPFFYFLKNGCYIRIKMIQSTLAVSPSAENMFQSYCLRKEQKCVGGFPTLRNIVNTVWHKWP